MIPVNEPRISGREAEYVLECIRTGWVSSEGRFITEFERLWAEYCGMPYGVAVSNGTTALQLAIACLDLMPGDEVIMPTFTIISCAQAAIYNGGVPVFVDSDPRSWCMDVARIESKITARTRAIMPVHIYGHPVNMAPVQALAEKYGLTIIEDAAEAHGATYKGQRCGGLGDLSCFSFYANKIITTGEGGMVLARSEAHAARLRSLRNLCFVPERRFYHLQLGHNFRLTNLQAAMGVAQLEQIDSALTHKRWLGQAYTKRLQQLPGLHLPVEEPWAQNVYWMYGIVLDRSVGIDAAEFGRRLARRSVMTRPFFLGMHSQPVLQASPWFRIDDYPVADWLAQQGLYLPSGLALTESQLDEVCTAVEAEWETLAK
jgi:perosamine synthetase